MQSLTSIDLVEAHAPVWQRLQPLLDKKYYPQALLFVGPRHAGILQFVNRYMATVICQGKQSPCGYCNACHLVQQGFHPDIHYVTPDKQDKAIKIEQIRTLQQDVYQTPQRGSHRFIVIDPADKMNVSSANALLKILEEPPVHTLFILLAEQTCILPPTILSRCQRYVFEPKEPIDYLSLGQFYLEDTTRRQLFEELETNVSSLCDLIEEKMSPCTLASLWAGHALEDTVWFLYLITAQLIHYQLTGGSDKLYPQEDKMAQLSRLIAPESLFKQIDKLNTLSLKMHHNINSNQLLALENLLLGYLGKTYD